MFNSATDRYASLMATSLQICFISVRDHCIATVVLITSNAAAATGNRGVSKAYSKTAETSLSFEPYVKYTIMSPEGAENAGNFIECIVMAIADGTRYVHHGVELI